MTAINVIRLRDCVHVLSDGAMVGPDGRLVGAASKVTPITHLSMVAATRGTTVAAAFFRDAALPGINSYDDAHKRLPGVLRIAVTGPIGQNLRAQFGPDILEAQHVVAGWSETRGPHAWILATTDLSKDYGVSAWSPVDIDGALLTPSTPELTARFARIHVEFDAAAAVALVAAQRELKAGVFANGKRGVGCFVQCTTIYQDRIETKILHKFPDVIGREICQ